MSRAPVSVITGFLGSGKTTLLSRLLRDPALARTAVIVNEFGASRPRPPAAGGERRGSRAARRRLRVLHGARRPGAHRGRPARAARARRRSALSSASSSRPPGSPTRADPACADDRPRASPTRFGSNRSSPRSTRRRRGDARCASRIGEAGRARRPHRRHQERPRRPGGERPRRAAARAQSGAPKLTAVHGAVDASRLFDGRARYDAGALSGAAAPPRRHRHLLPAPQKPLHAVTLEPFPAGRSPSIAVRSCCG